MYSALHLYTNYAIKNDISLKTLSHNKFIYHKCINNTLNQPFWLKSFELFILLLGAASLSI